MSKYDNSDLLSNDQKQSYREILLQQLATSKDRVLNHQKYQLESNKKLLQKIKGLMNYRQDKTFTMFAGQPIQFFHMQWSFVSQKLPFNWKNIVVQLVDLRTRTIVKQLKQQKLKIQEPKIVVNYDYEIDEKNLKVFTLKGQSQQIKKKILQINNALQSIEGQNNQDTNETNLTENKGIFDHLYTQQKKKQIQAFIKKKQQQKQQRKKRLQAQKLKQQQVLAEKQRQIKQNQQKELKAKKEEHLKKNMQLHKKREEQKILRQQRKQQYQKFIKSINEKPRLFELLQKNYQKRVQYEQMQKRHKMISEKKQIHVNLDTSKITQHEKNYQQISKAKAEERKRRYEQYLQQHRNNPVRRHSSFENSRAIDKDQEQKQKAKQKYQKIKHYQGIVKQKYKPKLDQDKKKEMQTLIQELQLNSRKKLKKTKLQNGAIVYEEIKQCDPRSIGMIYLQKTKQMAAKAKQIKGVSSSVQLQSGQIKKKPIDYLEQLRKNPKIRPVRRMSFVDKPNMTFDEKISKVFLQSEKLSEIAKQNEMKLKFGKFKTSQQILNCKQQIDKSYLQIAKMKLKLIKQDSN